MAVHVVRKQGTIEVYLNGGSEPYLALSKDDFGGLAELDDTELIMALEEAGLLPRA